MGLSEGGPGAFAVRVRVDGPLAPFAGAFWEVLSGKGYSRRPAGELLRLAGQLSRWMASRGLGAGDVTATLVGEFARDRRTAGCRKWVTSRSLLPLLGCLPASARCEAADAGAGGLLVRYRGWLVTERGLAASSAAQYVRLAGAFVSWLPDGEQGVAALTGAQVTAYVLQRCPQCSGAQAKQIVTALRSLLRFLHADGHVAVSLAGVVPGAARWRAARLPVPVRRGQITALLDACDRGTGLGARDYAVILTMVRLGLRAGEVASLRITDVNWRDGLLTVHGKGNREDVLPLPADVGDAMAGYLMTARPGRPASPYLFTCTVAPHGPLSTGSVGGITIRACRRAGIPVFGPHQLRHALACEVLAHGAALEEVAQLLRHSDLTTTALYARADLPRLAELARPCPQGETP
jgi:integrase/recombinase XerD